MPSYMLRQVPDALWARVRAEATRAESSLRDTVIALLEDALAVRDGRRAGGTRRAETLTAAERSASARRAVTARWTRALAQPD